GAAEPDHGPRAGAGRAPAVAPAARSGAHGGGRGAWRRLCLDPARGHERPDPRAAPLLRQPPGDVPDRRRPADDWALARRLLSPAPAVWPDLRPTAVDDPRGPGHRPHGQGLSARDQPALLLLPGLRGG